MSCNCCASVDLSQCQDGIILNGHLDQGQEYRVVITGKQGVYEKSYIANADGAVTILPVDFPPGLFNPYAGPLRLELYRANVKQSFRLLLTFECVDITVLNGTFQDNEIGEVILL